MKEIFEMLKKHISDTSSAAISSNIKIRYKK